MHRLALDLVQELHDLAPQQLLTVTEPARLHVSGPGAFRVLSWKGTAFEVQASTDLKQWSPVSIVTNLTGTLEFTDPTRRTICSASILHAAKPPLRTSSRTGGLARSNASRNSVRSGMTAAASALSICSGVMRS